MPVKVVGVSGGGCLDGEGEGEGVKEGWRGVEGWGMEAICGFLFGGCFSLGIVW